MLTRLDRGWNPFSDKGIAQIKRCLRGNGSTCRRHSYRGKIAGIGLATSRRRRRRNEPSSTYRNRRVSAAPPPACERWVHIARAATAACRLARDEPHAGLWNARRRTGPRSRHPRTAELHDRGLLSPRAARRWQAGGRWRWREDAVPSTARGRRRPQSGAARHARVPPGGRRGWSTTSPLPPRSRGQRILDRSQTRPTADPAMRSAGQVRHPPD